MPPFLSCFAATAGFATGLAAGGLAGAGYYAWMRRRQTGDV